MDEPQELARVRQAPHPGVPRRVGEAVAEAREDEGDHKDGVRRGGAVDDVGGEMAARAEEGDAALAPAEVDPVVEGGGADVAY